MLSTEFALIVAAARKEVEKALASRDKSAIEAFAPSFAIKDGRLFMAHGGSTVDLGNVIGPRGIDGFNGIDGQSIKGDKGDPGEAIRGDKGEKGDRGDQGEKGDRGDDGQDGVGVANAYVSDAGYLVIELTTGRKITAGYVRGKDGKSGKASIIYGGGAGSSGGGGAGTDLDYDEATRILSSSTGTGVTLPLFTDADDGLAPASGGGTDNFLRADGTWAAPSSGSTTGAGSAVLDFGAAPGTNTAETVVATAIPAGASVRAWFQSEGNADHNEIEHRLIFPSRVGLTCGAITDGVGFTVYAETELRLTGDVTCRWQWSA